MYIQCNRIVILWWSQGWRTREHISCHQSLGTWVWRSKMSWTSLVQAEWPVESKRDFNIITCYTTVFTGDHWAFRNLWIDPSNHYIRKPSSEILAVQDRFPNRFNRGPRCPDPCHTQPVSNSTDMKVSTGQHQQQCRHHRQEEESEPFYIHLLKCAEGKEMFDSDEKKREGEEEHYWTYFFNYRPL